MKVAVVVLTYNGVDHTKACLTSLLASSHPTLDIIVVDNASQDGTVDAVRREFPQVHVVANPENVGFSAGNNVGARAALARGADLVLLLNNDTTVARDCVQRLAEVAAADVAPRLLCPLIYYADPPDVIWYAGAHWSPGKMYNRSYTGLGRRDHGQFGDVRPVTCATGAALLVPRAVFEAIGYLPEDFFLQTEDVEYSARALAAGIGIAVVGEAKVWHHVSSASGGEHSPLIAYYAMRNSLEVNRRYARLHGLRALRLQVGLVLLFLVHACRSPQRAATIPATIEGWRDYRRGRLGARPPGGSCMRSARE